MYDDSTRKGAKIERRQSSRAKVTPRRLNKSKFVLIPATYYLGHAVSVSVSVRSCLPTLLLAALSDPIEGALAAHPGSDQPIPFTHFPSSPSLPFPFFHFTSIFLLLHWDNQSSAHLPEPSRQP